MTQEKKIVDYNAEEVSKILEHFEGKIVLYKSVFHDGRYITGLLKKVGIIHQTDNTSVISLEMVAPIIYSKSPPTKKDILEIIFKYLSGEKVKRTQFDQYADLLSDVINLSNEWNKEIKRIPRWRILERKNKEKEIIKKIKELRTKHEPVIEKINRPLEIEEEETPDLEVEYRSGLHKLFTESEIRSIKKINLL